MNSGVVNLMKAHEGNTFLKVNSCMCEVSEQLYTAVDPIVSRSDVKKVEDCTGDIGRGLGHIFLCRQN